MGKVFQKGQSVARGITDSFRSVGDRMQRIGTQMSAAITLPLIGAGGLALKTAADYETLQQSLSILTGSAEEGAKQFERLKRFSAGTPFQLKGLAEAQKTLMGFSLTADEAFDSMSMIGDIAAVTGGDMQAISVAFGQAAAEGKLLTRDIRQLINQGVPAVQLLADSMGVATSEIFDLASQGEITFAVLQQAFRDATSEGGRFANGMEKQSQTLAGVFSTLRDNVSIALGELGNTIVESFNLKEVVKNVTTQIQNIVKAFTAMSDRSKKQILTVAAALGAGGPLLVALGVAAKAVAGFVSVVTSKFTLITGAIGTVVISAQWLADNWTNVLDTIAQQTESWARATQNTLSFLGKAMSFFGRGMGSAMAPYFAGLDAAILQLQDLGKDASTNFTSFQEAGVNAFENVSKAVQEMLNSLSDGGLNEFLNMITSQLASANSQVISLIKKIEQVSAQTREKSEQAAKGLESMRAKTDKALQGMSLFQIATRGATKEMSISASTAAELGSTIGQAFSQAALHGKNLLDVMGKLAKQLAARTFVDGLIMLLSSGTAGTGGLAGALFGGLFGGKRAHGGPVRSGKGYVVGENGPELFMPKSSGQIVSNKQMSMGGTRKIHISLNGEFVQSGTDLRAVIDESKFVDLS